MFVRLNYRTYEIRPKTIFSKWFNNKEAPRPKGIYIYGAVGRGEYYLKLLLLIFYMRNIENSLA